MRHDRFHPSMLRGHPGNITLAVRRVIVRAVNHDLVVTSTTGGAHSSTSFHFSKPRGRAVDFGVESALVGTSKQRSRLVAFQKFLVRRFGCGAFLELFGPDNAFNCKNGRSVSLDEGSALENAHDNHVHVAPSRILPLPQLSPEGVARARRWRSRMAARRAGARFVMPIQRAAMKHNISLPLALALVKKESNFINQVGHDRNSKGALIPPARPGVVLVSRGLVQAYLKVRAQFGAQGMGLTQLTSPGIQDLAEKRGGLDKIGPQLDVGFEVLAGHIRALGKRKGIGAYNGGRGNPQLDYADSVLRLEAEFRAKGVK